MRLTRTLALILACACSFAEPAAGQGRRIAVGGVTAESNSLYPRAQLMREQEAQDRQQWIEENSRASTVASGVIEAAGKLGLEVYPVLRAGASSLGHVEKASFNTALDKLVDQIKTATPRFDGVILTLHGAMVVDGYPHGDAEVVRRVREAMGERFPIVVTHDFHANVSDEIVEYSDVLITYKDNPHLDTKARGIQAATIIAKMINGTVTPVQAIAKPPMIVNIVHQNTFAAPYKAVTDESRRLEATDPRILAVSVPGGYQWADVPAMGPSVIVVTDNDPELAEREATRLSGMLWDLRDQLVFRVPDAATAVKEAIVSQTFPVVLMDTGDNIGGGSTGDGTFILEELTRQKAEGWVVVIADPEANEAAFSSGVGGAFDQRVGGKTDRIHGDPVRIVGPREIAARRQVHRAGGPPRRRPLQGHGPDRRHRGRRLHAGAAESAAPDQPPEQSQQPASTDQQRRVSRTPAHPGGQGHDGAARRLRAGGRAHRGSEFRWCNGCEPRSFHVPAHPSGAVWYRQVANQRRRSTRISTWRVHR